MLKRQGELPADIVYLMCWLWHPCGRWVGEPKVLDAIRKQRREPLLGNCLLVCSPTPKTCLDRMVKKVLIPYWGKGTKGIDKASDKKKEG